MANGDVDQEVGDQTTQSITETNLPSAAPKAELVKTPDAPRATPPDPDAQQKSYYEQQRIDRYNHEQEQQAKFEKIRQDYYNRILSIKNEAHPEPPKFEKELPYPGSAQDPNRQKQNVGQIFGQVAALATVAAVVFGKRHGQWGRAIQQQGIGEFLKAYRAGQQQAAREQLINWQKANEVIRDENRQRAQDYKDILADRHLTLSEQHEAIMELAQSRQDYKLYQAAASKDLAGILANFAAKDKADIHNSKAALSILTTVQKEYFTNAKVDSWVDGVKTQTKGKLDPLSSPEALREAEQKYPMSQWIDETTKQKTFKFSAGTKKTPSGNTLATDTLLSPQQARDNLKPGDWFEGTDHNFYQIPSQ